MSTPLPVPVKPEMAGLVVTLRPVRRAAGYLVAPRPLVVKVLFWIVGLVAPLTWSPKLAAFLNVFPVIVSAAPVELT